MKEKIKRKQSQPRLKLTSKGSGDKATEERRIFKMRKSWNKIIKSAKAKADWIDKVWEGERESVGEKETGIREEERDRQSNKQA